MNDYSERVLKFLQSEPFRTFKAKEISRRLKIPQQDYSKLRNTLRSLVRKGEILRLEKNRYGVGKAAAEVIGRLHVNAQGYGFVIPETGDDVFVSQKNMGKALHKDIVRVRLFASSSGQRQEGKVVEVIERVRTAIVGTFRKGRRNAYVIPDDLKIPKDIIVDSASTGNAKDGQKVVVKIEDWEGEYGNPYGAVTEVLGYADEPGVDILSIFYGHSLPLGFPQHVEDAAEKIPTRISPEEIAGRLDLRDLDIITIDPADAKDFDDAISLEMLDNGNRRLGVHIADVSHYVRPGSDLDKEALERGTSVYLVDRVVPMLPEKLSNGICSLSEGSDKLCYSVLMELDSHANLVNYSIRETVIRSSKRFTYEEAQGVLDGKIFSPFADLLGKMNKLYRQLAAKRHRRGSIDFDTLELDIELDDTGYPVAIRRKLRQDTNRMIEEFMLLANETIARHVGIHLAKQNEGPLPFVYRIHEKPDAQSIQDLVSQVNAFGVNVNSPKRTTPHFFYKLSTMIKDHPASPILESAMLRAMMKARYSTENVGHFGLAYKYYTHFTSPIRRYPDLLVHRLLKHYAKETRPPMKRETLEKMCQVATEREIVAQEAERDTVKLKQVEYMERHLGEEFEGYISRIVNFGFFVHLPDILADGLVHVTSLDDDYYIYDEKSYSMIGSHRNRRYRQGDKVRVRVAKVDRNERIIDFVLC